MENLNKEIGNFGEDTASKYLEESGYVILDRNFRCRSGEIDIIARDGDYIVFIEVKTRRGSFYGTPGEAVNELKQHKIIRVSEAYIMKKKLFNCDFRFDVIEIIVDKAKNASIKLIKDAFQVI